MKNKYISLTKATLCATKKKIKFKNKFPQTILLAYNFPSIDAFFLKRAKSIFVCFCISLVHSHPLLSIQKLNSQKKKN